MKVVKCVFAGKTYELPANNSGWISDSETKIDAKVIELLKNRPRVGKGSKGEPIIQDDLGKRISLGAASLRLEGETIGGAGSGGSKCPRMFALEALKFNDASRKNINHAENQVLNSLTRALLTMIFSGVSTVRLIANLLPNHTETSFTA